MSTPGTRELIAARAAVFALRAVAPGQQPPSGASTVLLGSEVMSDEAAAMQLAAMAKPLACKVGLRDGRLLLDCSPLSPELFELRIGLAGLLGDGSAPAIGSSEIPRSGQVLLLGDRGQSMRLHAEDFRLFSNDYVITCSYIATGDPATVEQASLGADWVVSFGPDESETRGVAVYVIP